MVPELPSEPNIFQAVPALSGYLGRLARAEHHSEHSDDLTKGVGESTRLKPPCTCSAAARTRLHSAITTAATTGATLHPTRSTPATDIRTCYTACIRPWTWKVTPRLTLDYGLRLSWYQPQYDSSKQASTFILADWNAAQAPRLYRPASIPPPGDGSVGSADSVRGRSDRQNPDHLQLPVLDPETTAVGNGARYGICRNARASPPRQSQSELCPVRRQLPAAESGPTLLATQPTALLGNNSLPANFLRPLYGYNSVTVYESAATSNNALQFALNRRASRGLFLGVTYTYSKALTTASSDTSSVRVDQFTQPTTVRPALTCGRTSP